MRLSLCSRNDDPPAALAVFTDKQALRKLFERGSVVDGNMSRFHSPTTQRDATSFASFADDIAAGADSLEELFEFLKAIIKCFDKTGIQVKPVEFWSQRDQFPQLHDLD